MAAIISTEPKKAIAWSRRRRGSFLSELLVSSSAPAAIGRLSQKIIDQCAYFASPPPRIGPAKLATAQTVVMYATDHARSRGEAISPITVCASAISPPPPMPCPQRPTIIIPMLGERAQMMDPTIKVPMPPNSTALRP